MHPLFIVQLNVAEQDEDRWNRWYDEVHLQEVVALSPGIVSARRYRQTSGNAAFQYLAIYEFLTQESMDDFVAHPDLGRLGQEYVAAWGDDRQRGYYEPLIELLPTRD